MSNRRLVRISGFAFWITAATFAASTLTAWHSFGLPAESGHSVPPVAHSGNWRLTHYLSAECPCSRDVARHLLARGPLTSADEEVVLIASADVPAENTLREQLNRRGFRVRTVSPDAAAIEGIEAVPILKIEAPGGALRFRGGYRGRNSAAGDYQDTAILSSLMVSAPLPAVHFYGCATSRRLRGWLDPLSLMSGLRS